MNEEIKNALELAKAIDAGLTLGIHGGWYPTKYVLPDEGEMVLVTCCTKKGQRSVNRAYYADGCWHGSGSMAGVIAWMPLPEPYKEEEHGENQSK